MLKRASRLSASANLFRDNRGNFIRVTCTSIYLHMTVRLQWLSWDAIYVVRFAIQQQSIKLNLKITLQVWTGKWYIQDTYWSNSPVILQHLLIDLHAAQSHRLLEKKMWSKYNGTDSQGKHMNKVEINTARNAQKPHLTPVSMILTTILKISYSYIKRGQTN